jgi:hypothetical protein
LALVALAALQMLVAQMVQTLFSIPLHQLVVVAAVPITLQTGTQVGLVVEEAMELLLAALVTPHLHLQAKVIMVEVLLTIAHSMLLAVVEQAQ